MNSIFKKNDTAGIDKPPLQNNMHGEKGKTPSANSVSCGTTEAQAVYFVWIQDKYNTLTS